MIIPFALPLSDPRASMMRRRGRDPVAAFPWALRLQTQTGGAPSGTNVAIGDPVPTWVDDRGTSGLTATAQVSHVPLLATSNGRRVIDFGNNYAFATPRITLAGMTFFAAMKLDSTSGTHGVFADTSLFKTYLQFINSTQLEFSTATGTKGTFTLPRALTTGHWFILELVCSGTTATIYINGQPGNTVTIGGDSIRLEALGRVSTSYFAGKIGCMLFANGAMAASDRARVRSALRAYWATSEYYTSPNGSDANDGWSADTPFATLAKLAVAPIYPGDRLYIKATDWREKFLLSSPWATGDRITVQPYGGSQIRLIGSSQVTAWEQVSGFEYRTPFVDAASYDYGVVAGVPRPRNVFWVRSADLAEANVQKLLPGVAGALTPGQFVRNGAYVHINIGTDPNAQRIEIPRNNEEGIRLLLSPQIDLWGFWVAFFDLNQYTSSGGNIALYNIQTWWGAEDGISPGGAGILYIKNFKCIRNGNVRTISDGAGDGLSCHFSMTVIAEDGEIRDNEKGGFNTLKEVNSTLRRVRLRGNNLNYNILATAAAAGTHVVESCIIEVTSLDTGNGIRRDGTNDAIIDAYNCTIIGTGVGVGMNGLRNAKNNILFGFSTGLSNVTTEDYNDIFQCATLRSNTTAGIHSVSADPKFFNAAAGHYGLRSGSPCIGTGINAGVTLTYDGLTPSDPPNMGAK